MCFNQAILCHHLRKKTFFLGSVTVDPETDEAGALFGKLASELQTNLAITDGVASGTLHYISGWTEFSSKVSEQSGNYIALKVNGVPADATVKYKLKGSSKAPVTLDQDRNIVVICTNKPNSVLQFTVTLGEDSVTKEVTLSGITFEPAPEQAGE